MPEKARELQRNLAAWRQKVGAKMPEKNEDPEAAEQAPPRRRRKAGATR
jgi:hypothetical protein